MAEDRGVEPHPISENLVFKASRGTNPTASSSKKVVGIVGFEPTTSWSQTRRTTRLCYTPNVWYLDTVSNRGPSPCKGDALPLSYPGNCWRKTEESNPIPVKRTWFSRPVAGPSPLHQLPLTWYRETGSNRPHLVLQTSALPTELSRQFSLG